MAGKPRRLRDVLLYALLADGADDVPQLDMKIISLSLELLQHTAVQNDVGDVLHREALGALQLTQARADYVVLQDGGDVIHRERFTDLGILHLVQRVPRRDRRKIVIVPQRRDAA